MTKINSILKDHYLFLLIFLGALFLRLFNLVNLTTFTGEEGYDFLLVRKMITQGEWTLLGPKIGPYNSLGQIFLGPAYYYLILPALLIFRFNPIGPAVLVAILSTLATLVVYFTGRFFFNNFIALASAAFFAFSPLLVEQGRSSNPAYFIPIFTSFLLFNLFMITKKKKIIYWVFTGVILGFLVQFHYTTLFLFLVLPFWFWLIRIRVSWKDILSGILAFLLTISPLLAFELRHQFFISKSIWVQITQGRSVASYSDFFSSFSKSLLTVFGSLFPYNNWFFLVTFLLILVGVSFSLVKFKDDSKLRALLYLKLLSGWVVLNLIFSSLYVGPPQAHYLSSSFIPLFVIGAIVAWKLNRFFNLGAILVIILTLFNLFSNSLFRDQGFNMPYGWNLKREEQAVSVIAQDYKEGSFNVAATLDGDTRGFPYRYLLDLQGMKPLDVEHYNEADFLYVIARDTEGHLLKSETWEISSFTNKKIEAVWFLKNDIKLFKLSHER